MKRFVLFYSDSATYGGHEIMAASAAAGLSALGHRVTFMHYSGNVRLRTALMAANESGASVEIHESPFGPLRLHTLQAPFRWNRIRRLRRSFLEAGPDVLILVQGHVESCATAVIAALRGRLPLVSYLPVARSMRLMRAPIPVLRDNVNRLYLRATAKFIVISQFVAAQLVKVAPRVRCEVVENVIASPERSLETRCEARRKLGLPTEGPLIGMVGRLDEQKGHDRMMIAMASAPELRHVRLAIVGDGPQFRRLEALAEEMDVAARVHFLGWQEQQSSRVYSAFDLLAIPSRYEGVPLVMLEALAHQIPVIATDADGMADWLPVGSRFDRQSVPSIVAAFKYAMSPASVPTFAPIFDRANLRADAKRYAREWEAALRRLLPSSLDSLI